MTAWRPGAPPLLVALLGVLLWICAALLAARGDWGVVLGALLGALGLALIVPGLIIESRARSRLTAALRSAAAGDAPNSTPDDPALAAAVRAVSDGVRTSLELLGQSQAERSQFEHALSAAGDVVIALDAADRIAYLNPAAQAALSPAEGVSPARVGAPLIEVIVDPELYAAVERAQRDGAAQSLAIQRGDRHYRAAIAPLGDGGPWSVVLALHDLTELHDAELARRDFFTNASHELRTPLATISAAAETLERARDAADAGRFREIIQVEAERMSQLVEEMLALARLESGLAQPDVHSIELGPLLDGAVERMRPQAERKDIEIVCAADDVTIHADADLVQRAALNLIQNAVKFTSTGGTVEVFTTLDMGPDTGAATQPATEPDTEPVMVWIHVRDTGVGVEPAEQGRVFQRFYRADRARTLLTGGGAGLGLAVVRHIAEIHGGSVELQSEVGVGSTFSFCVPVAQLT